MWRGVGALCLSSSWWVNCHCTPYISIPQTNLTHSFVGTRGWVERRGGLVLVLVLVGCLLRNALCTRRNRYPTRTRTSTRPPPFLTASPCPYATYAVATYSTIRWLQEVDQRTPTRPMLSPYVWPSPAQYPPPSRTPSQAHHHSVGTTITWLLQG